AGRLSRLLFHSRPIMDFGERKDRETHAFSEIPPYIDLEQAFESFKQVKGIHKKRRRKVLSLPNIPDITPSISLTREEAVNLILSSIAMQEMGLGHIINAEAEKIQYVLGTLTSGGLTPA